MVDLHVSNRYHGSTCKQSLPWNELLRKVSLCHLAGVTLATVDSHNALCGGSFSSLIPLPLFNGLDNRTQGWSS